MRKVLPVLILMLFGMSLPTGRIYSGHQPIEVAPKKIEGVKPAKWEPAELTVQVGDIVEWSVKAGTHGVAFNDGDKAKQVLDFTGGLSLQQHNFKPPMLATHASGTGDSTQGMLLVRAKVKAIPAGMTEVPFFCSFHGTGMAGKLKLTAAAPAVKKIEGVAPMTWEPKELTVKPGDMVEWSVKSGLHGVVFTDWDKAKQVLEPVGGLPILPNGFKPPAQATHTNGAGAGKGTLLFRAKVKAIPAGMTEVPFFCTVHGTTMDGKLKLEAAAAGTKVTINGVAPMKWDPLMATVKPGDTVEWVSKSGFHGVLFNDFDKAKQVLKIDTTVGLPIKAQAALPAPAQGTDGAGAGTLLVRATVQAIPAGMTEVPFICTVHGKAMAGKLVLAPDDKKDKKKKKKEKEPD